MTSRSLLHDLLRFVFKPGLRALWLNSVEGLEHIPPTGAVLLASNHESYLDFLLLDAALPRPPIYLAAEVFYGSRPLAWAFDQMNFIKVDRQNSGGGAVRSALRALADDNLVALYPEGTRSPDGRLQRAHDGIGMLAHMSEAPVVPVAITGAHEAWAKGERRPRLHPCCIRFGEPLCFSKSEYRADRTIVVDSTRRIMKAIAAMADEEYLW